MLRNPPCYAHTRGGGTGRGSLFAQLLFLLVMWGFSAAHSRTVVTPWSWQRAVFLWLKEGEESGGGGGGLEGRASVFPEREGCSEKGEFSSSINFQMSVAKNSIPPPSFSLSLSTFRHKHAHVYESIVSARPTAAQSSASFLI